MSEPHAQARTSRYILLGIIALLFVVGGIGGWAAFTQIQGAVIANGQIVVESTSKRVQHREGGIVGKILVRNGDEVTAGQTLIELDETEIRAELGIIETIRLEWLAKADRLRAERDGKQAISFNEELQTRSTEAAIAALVSGQTNLFKAQNASLAGRKQQLGERVEQLRQEISGLTAQLDANKTQARLINEELKDTQQLLAKGLVQRPRALALEREAARLIGQSGQLVAEIARTKGRIGETKLQLIQLDDDARTRTLTELREAEAKLQEFAERRIAVSSKLKRTVITAPRAGQVHELAVHTLGGVIAPGETIMLIVPRGDRLIIEAQVRPQDIDQVSIGQAALLRFPNADAQLTPQVSGEVHRISADARQPDPTQAPHYLVRLSLTQAELNKLEGLKLKPGMPVEAFIQTRMRSPLAYLTQPLTDQLARAFREK